VSARDVPDESPTLVQEISMGLSKLPATVVAKITVGSGGRPGDTAKGDSSVNLTL